MKVLISFLVILFGYSVSPVFGQQEQTDWYKKLAESDTDTARVNALNKLSYQLAYNNPDSAILLAEQALSLSEKIGYRKGEGDANKVKGLYFLYQGKQKEAMTFFEKDLRIKESLGDPVALEIACSNMGNIYMSQMEFDLAEKFYQRSISLCREMKDPDCETEGSFNLGNLAFYQGKYDEAREHYQRYLDYFRKKGDRNRVAMVGINIGTIHSREGRFAEALTSLIDVWRFAKKAGNNRYLQTLANNIGNIYFDFKDYDKALEYLSHAADLAVQAGDQFSLSNTWLNLGNVYDNLGDLDSAKIFYRRALDASIKSNRQDARLITSNNLAFLEFNEGGSADKAEASFLQILNEAEEAGLEQVRGRALQNLGHVYSYSGRSALAVKYFQEALIYVSETGNKKEQADIRLELAKLYALGGRSKEAVELINLYKEANDSLFSDGLIRQIGKMEALFQNEKKQFQLEALRKEQLLDKALINQKVEEARLQNIFLSATGIGFFLMMGMAGFAWRSFTQKRKAHREVSLQKEQTELQKQLVEERNLEITDSINYARRLQTSILPSSDLLSDLLPEHFLFYRPRDIVSGDFYWVHASGDEIYCAAADCTGHGVPGAIVSMVGFNGLNQSVTEKLLSLPSDILNNTSEYIRKSFAGGKTGIRDGMDIALCRFNRKTGVVHFSGANNPLWIWRQKSGEVEELKGERQPLGFYEHGKAFTTFESKLEKGDVAFLFSDGFADQFGGEKGKKFMSGRFRKLLAANAGLPAAEQEKKLMNAFEEWKGDAQQVDDVLVWGIRLIS